MEFFKKNNKNDILNFILDVFIETNKNVILPYFKNLKKTEIDNKLDENDFVTLADKKAEEEISNRLIRSFPDIKIIGEEGFFLNKSNPVKYNEKFYWTVDPIDGTKNYIKGDQNFCSMISLIENKKTIAAFIFDPLKNILFYSFLSSGCYTFNLVTQKTKKIKIKNSSDLIGTGTSKGFNEQIRQKIIDNFNTKTKRIFIGSAGIEATKLISNEVNFFLHGRVTPWDHSPVDLIVREAGGVAFMLNDKNVFDIDIKGSYLASNNIELWHKLKKIFFK